MSININDVIKSYGDRDLLKIESLKVGSRDIIGIVGLNGTGKTTLLEMIAGIEKPDSGSISVSHNKSLKYIPQLEMIDESMIKSKYSKILNIENEFNENMSGGEITRFKLAKAFEEKNDIYLIDEPTNNLDLQGQELIINLIKDNVKSALIISHSRELLNTLCNKIWEIENKEIKEYHGNYSSYKEEKDKEIKNQIKEYDKYIKERNRLIDAKLKIETNSSKTKKTPSRMGNSEARLHKMGNQNAKKSLDNSAKSIESRLEQLDQKENYQEEASIRINILESSKVFSKISISGSNINKSFKNKKIFEKARFNIYNNKKIGLVGPNGSGKSTLIDMIINQEGVKVNQNIKIGYFNQKLEILDDDKSIIENIMDTSVHDENFSRLILARLLFRGDSVYKQVRLLSGGEKVKLSFAKIILQDINFLILDEPTNYLDIESIEVIEDLLINYDGNILLVSHDRDFLNKIVDEVLIIEDYKIKSFDGNLEEYEENKKKKANKRPNDSEILSLELEIARLNSMLSIEDSNVRKDELNLEYIDKVKKLNKLKSNI